MRRQSLRGEEGSSAMELSLGGSLCSSIARKVATHMSPPVGSQNSK